MKVAVLAGPEGEEGLLLELQAAMMAVRTAKSENNPQMVFFFIESSLGTATGWRVIDAAAGITRRVNIRVKTKGFYSFNLNPLKKNN